MKSLAFWLAGVLSAAYLGSVIWFFDVTPSTLKEMPLNGLGDFLAGLFGPLAFLWLVVGYYLQRTELKQNTIALELQAKEMRNSVEQQTILAEAARDQLAFDRNLLLNATEDQRQKLRPRFTLKGRYSRSSATKYLYWIDIKNTGATIHDVRIDFDCDLDLLKPSSFDLIESGDTETVDLCFSANSRAVSTAFTIAYLNQNDESAVTKFKLVPIDEFQFRIRETA